MVTESPKGFQCFTRHHNFHHVKVGSEAESANTEGAEAFKEDLHGIIINEKYVPERVFSDNETNLFSECVLGHSYTCQQSKSVPRFKALRHIMLLLRGNVAEFR